MYVAKRLTKLLYLSKSYTKMTLKDARLSVYSYSIAKMTDAALSDPLTI